MGIIDGNYIQVNWLIINTDEISNYTIDFETNVQKKRIQSKRYKELFDYICMRRYHC